MVEREIDCPSFDEILRSLGADEENLGLFLGRLGGAWAGIRRGFLDLYGGKAGAPALLGRLAQLLAAQYRGRSPALKARDAADLRGRPWYLEPGLAAYMLYLDRFAGDFAGLARRIDWLEALGIGLVHLMPFMKSPPGNNDGGYAVSDYLEVDPRYGSRQDLERTAALLHSKGRRLAADLVLNHTADDHPWARAARAGYQKYRNYYYIFPDRESPDRYEAAMPEVFPAAAPGNFTFVPELGSWVMTVFHDFQWDLDWSNPEVFLEMLEVVLEMANSGVDLLRLDAVPYLWKRPGTSCQNLPEAHAIVRLLKAAAGTVAPALAFLAEAIVQPSEIVKYLDSADGAGGVREECQLAYHASLMALLWEALATKSARLLALSFGRETRLAPGTAWLSYARCHDDIGLGFDEGLIRELGFDPALHRRFLVEWYTGRFPGSLARGRPFMEDPVTGEARISGTCASLCGLETALEAGDAAETELALRRIELLHALVSSLTGIPMIYSGDELATTNDYSWEESEHRAGDNRWMHRPGLDWARAEEALATGSRGPGQPLLPHQRVFSWIRTCLAIRKGLPVLAQDSPFEVLPTEGALLAVRRGSSEWVLVVANLGPGEVGYLPPPSRGDAELRDLLRGGVLHEGETLRLGAYEVVWLAPESSAPALQSAVPMKYPVKQAKEST